MRRPGRDPGRFRAMFEPRGVVVVGAASHPGKFGFVAAHNILAHDYDGDVYLVKRDGEDLLGRQCLASVDDLPDGKVDLAVLCTPARANPEIVRQCAAKGIGAVFVVSAGYGEAGEEGERAQEELVALCDELGITMAGPNGQGLVSPPVGLCAQIVAPMPPRGRIAVASQSGNFVSSWGNLSEAMGVGMSRGVSIGNAAAEGVPDYAEYFARDPETAVGLVYLEGVPDGRSLFDRLRPVVERKPLVVLKGGTTAGGARAAASHTGSLAGDAVIFDGMCRQAGITRAPDVEAAFEAAAAFATMPLPKGNRVFVLTTAGGWGVLTADRITASRELELMAIPEDLVAAFDDRLPPRWSRNNPADLAGGETRDTVPECMELAMAHPEVDSVIFLGLGIQSNQGRLERSGPFWPDHGLERICGYHDRQDRRFAETAVDLMQNYDKPMLLSTELAIAHPENAGVAALRERGVPCYATAQRSVAALEHLTRYSKWRRERGLG